MTLQKKRKKSRFWIFKKRKKRILELCLLYRRFRGLVIWI